MSACILDHADPNRGILVWISSWSSDDRLDSEISVLYLDCWTVAAAADAAQEAAAVWLVPDKAAVADAALERSASDDEWLILTSAGISCMLQAKVVGTFIVSLSEYQPNCERKVYLISLDDRVQWQWQ